MRFFLKIAKCICQRIIYFSCKHTINFLHSGVTGNTNRWSEKVVNLCQFEIFSRIRSTQNLQGIVPEYHVSIVARIFPKPTGLNLLEIWTLTYVHTPSPLELSEMCIHWRPSKILLEASEGSIDLNGTKHERGCTKTTWTMEDQNSKTNFCTVWTKSGASNGETLLKTGF